MKRKAIIAGIVAVLGIFVLVTAFTSVQQSRYLRLRIFDKEIVSMELVEYEDVAFESDILSSKTLEDDNEEIFQDLMDAMNMQNIAFIHKKTTSVVVFFYYEDGSVMNAYIDGNKMGLSYGSVWIKVKGLSEILKQFQ
jgi:hypothetical protein